MNATPSRIFELAEFTLQNFNKKDVLAGKQGSVWRKYSAKEYEDTTNAIGYGLLNIGIDRGDKIAIISAIAIFVSMVLLFFIRNRLNPVYL